METLLTEAQKIIGNQFKIQVVSSGVGPITEKDLTEAQSVGAVLFGFDVPV